MDWLYHQVPSQPRWQWLIHTQEGPREVPSWFMTSMNVPGRPLTTGA